MVDSKENRASFSALPHTISLEQQEFDIIFTQLLAELRKRASWHCRNERSPSVATGDLLNSLYVRLGSNSRIAAQVASKGKLHFLSVAGRAMREILIEAARRRSAHKRGRDFAFVTLSHVDEFAKETISPELLLDLEEALCALQQVNSRQADIIQLRFYGGFTVAELHAYLGLSDATVARDISAALAWLTVIMKNHVPHDRS